MGVKLGIALGKGDMAGARQVCSTAVVVALLICGGGGLFVWRFSRQIGSIFSADHELLDLYGEVGLPLACMMVTFGMAVFLERIPMTMGRTKAVMWLGLAGSWVGQVPAVLLATTYWRHDAVGLYMGVAAGYFLLCVLLAAVIWRTDWQLFADKARARSEVQCKQ